LTRTFAVGIKLIRGRYLPWFEPKKWLKVSTSGQFNFIKKGNTVNKSELIDAIADSADLSKSSAARALDAVLGSVQGALANGDQVSLVGFGTFSVKHRAARSGRNPQTGAEIQIKASNVPSFKAGKALKDSVN
jgi:DNA-binding protein HU-beta